jgi:GT2 family glycosyltransferase
MYGTDICMEAARRGRKSYAIPAFCIHNTNGYSMLPWEFWRGYLYMRRKWRQQLPVLTPCAEITRWGLPAMWWNVDRLANLILRRHRPGKRVWDPGVLYRTEMAVGSETAAAFPLSNRYSGEKT